MKQKNLIFRKVRIAVTVFSLISILFAIMLSSFSTRRMADDMWKMLGITKQTGDEKIKSSFINGYLYYYGVKNLRNIGLSDRGALAKDLLSYTKQFVSSALFTKEYEDMRKSVRPPEETLKHLRTIEEIQKEEIAKVEKSIRDTEKNMKDMPQYARNMEPMLAILKDNLKKYQDPKNSYFASIAMGEKYDQENQVKNFKERMKQWESSYPENVNQFVAGRLQRMLNATKDIDYNAGLVEKWGKNRFVNQTYEGKNTEWKQGYRAGKEVTETARTFAQKWLDELKTK